MNKVYYNIIPTQPFFMGSGKALSLFTMNFVLNRVFFGSKSIIIIFHLTQLLLFTVANAQSRVDKSRSIQLYSILCWYMAFICMSFMTELVTVIHAVKHVWNGHREMPYSREHFVLQLVIYVFIFGWIVCLCSICLKPQAGEFDCQGLQGLPLCIFLKGLIGSYVAIYTCVFVYLMIICCRAYKKTPILFYIPYIHQPDDDECSICMTLDNNAWVKTPCLHVYHESCIQTWMTYNLTCPICRTRIQ